MSKEQILDMLEEKKERLEDQLRIVSTQHIEDDVTVAELTFGVKLLDEMIRKIR